MNDRTKQPTSHDPGGNAVTLGKKQLCCGIDRAIGEGNDRVLTDWHELAKERRGPLYNADSNPAIRELHDDIMEALDQRIEFGKMIQDKLNRIQQLHEAGRSG